MDEVHLIGPLDQRSLGHTLDTCVCLTNGTLESDIDLARRAAPGQWLRHAHLNSPYRPQPWRCLHPWRMVGAAASHKLSHSTTVVISVPESRVGCGESKSKITLGSAQWLLSADQRLNGGRSFPLDSLLTYDSSRHVVHSLTFLFH